MKLLFFILFISYIFGADVKQIENKIKQNKSILQENKQEQNRASQRVKALANSLQQEETRFSQIEKNLKQISSNIANNQVKLKDAKVELETLNKRSEDIEKYKNYIEEKIVKSVVDKYTTTIGKEFVNKKSINEIVEKEKFRILFDDSKENILKSNIEYFKITNLKNENDVKRETLEKFIAQNQAEEKKFSEVKKAQESSIEKLKAKHKAYQQELKAIVQKQNKINSILSQLNIVRETELQKIKRAELKAKREKEKAQKAEKARLAKLKKAQKAGVPVEEIADEPQDRSKDIKILSRDNFENDVDMKVRNLGNTNQGLKIANSNVKMKAPLDDYTVTKKFGAYLDPIYKIELFNESITMKSSSKNVKVHSALQGQVVYAKKDAGVLGSVVILKHSGDLHTIYSQLSQIAPTISVGKVIPQGYVVGRIEDTLVFQATKNNSYLNPAELF